MHHLTGRAIRLHLLLTLPGDRDERGDVPGWVLITVMTVGLVAIISAVAGDELTRLLRIGTRAASTEPGPCPRVVAARRAGRRSSTSCWC